MAGQKLTEKALASSIGQDASFIISQTEMVDSKPIEAIRRAQIAAVVSALRKFGINQDYATTARVEEILQGYVNNIEQSANGITVTYGDGSQVEIPIESGGLAFDEVYYDKDTGYFHIRMEGVDVVDPTYIGGGGGSGSGGGSKLTFSCYTPPSFSVIDSAASAPIEFKYESVDADTGIATGSGNLAVTVGGIVRTNMVIQQGDHQTVDVYKYLSKGNNTVRLTITDSYGATATRSFTVSLETFEVAWSLGATAINNESSLSFYITPTGNGSKSIYTYVDGKLYSTDTVTTSGRRLTKTITGLAHGGHKVEVYGNMNVGGTELESNHLTAAVAQVLPGYEEAVVAVNWPAGPLTQYTTVNIPYVAIDPNSNPAMVLLMEGEGTLAEVEVDQTAHTWAYRPLTAGSMTLGIRCGETTVTNAYKVEGLEVNVEEITDGLELKIDPSTISNLRTWSQNGYSFTLSDHFDLVNGGLMVDGDGVHCIRITAGDRLMLNYDPFSEDVIMTGKELKIIYRISDCSNKETVGIGSLSGGKGLEVRANNAYLRGDQNTIVLSTCEDEKTELDVNIQRAGANSDRLMVMWESCSTFAYKQYAQQEDFRHNPTTGIVFGSDDADVYLYLLRAYNRDLTDAEIKANYIVDGADGEEIHARHERNDIYDGTGTANMELAAQKNPDCHFVLINAKRMTLGKKDAVDADVRHIYIAGGAEHQFTARNAVMKVQGTSSVEHAPTAGPNINFTFKEGITLDDGTVKDGYAMNGEANSIPTNLITFKKNIASQDHIINRACAYWYNKFQPSVREARKKDPRVRDCLESTMCAVFFHNTDDAAVTVGPDIVQPGETIFFGLGNICSNKDAVEVFDYDDIVIEVKNNTEPQVRFKSNDLTGDNFDNNYEFRYINEAVYTEEQGKAEWQKVQDFVYATDYTAATNNPLPAAATIGGKTYTTDSAEYRKAKWKAEAPELFDMDTLYWHHNITLFFLLRDNRAKNMFWSKSKTTGKWGLWFNWDNDTGLCRNNEGYVDMEPGYMDFDTIGTADVFNGADNAVFTNLRECNFDGLRASYLDRENAGAWDIDAFYKYCEESQEQICESLWIEDAEHNAIRTLENLGTAAYLERATGRLRLHIKKALTFQKALIDSYYNATASTADSASFRGYTPQTWAGVKPSGKFTIMPYTNMYINVLAGSTSYQRRANAGETVELDITAALNDTEIYIRNAGWIQEMGDLSALYLGQFEASKLRRVRKLLIGSSVEGYYNTSFTTASFNNCRKLEELNMGGLVNAAQTFDLSGNLYLKTIYTKGSGVSGLRFARNGRLRTAELNAIASLYMNGLWLLETLDVESYDNLGTLTIEACDQIDSLAIVRETIDKSLSRLRLVGVDWRLTNTDLLDRLLTIGGLSDSGFSQDTAYLTGSVHVPVMRQSKLTAYREAWSDLAITYDSLVQQYLVTFTNWDGEVLYTVYVDRNDTAPDPVASGLIPAPTRESSASTVYTYAGWDGELTGVISSRTLTARYDETPRKYTVRWFDHLGTVLDTQTVNYGDNAVYSGQEPERTNEEAMAVYYLFNGWDKSTGFVTCDTDVTALWERGELPPPGANTEQLTGTEVYAIRQQKKVRDYFETKDRVCIPMGFDPQYTNIRHTDLASEMVFDGETYVDTGIKLLSEGVNACWTLVADLEFTSTDADATMLCCMQDDGFIGFKVRYAGGIAVQWSTNSYGAGQTTRREIVVLRHEAGSRNLKVYSSKQMELTVGYTELTKLIDTKADCTLVIGAAKSDGGEYYDFAKGILHSCRLWYTDLGDVECRKIACWPRETYKWEVGTFGAYKQADDLSKGTNIDFICASILSAPHRMNPMGTNEGGFLETEMYQYLRARVLPAMPLPWQKMMLDCIVNYMMYVDGTNHNIQNFRAKMWLPSLIEMQGGTSEPWIYEGAEHIPYFINNESRVKFTGPDKLVSPDYVYFYQESDPALDPAKNVQDGDLWYCTESGKTQHYLRYKGGWFAASSFWLRGASISNAAYFCIVSWNGNIYSGGNSATFAYGVCPRFSI